MAALKTVATSIWVQCFQGWEKELGPFFGPREMEPLLRRAGWHVGQLGQGSPMEAAGHHGLPLEAIPTGFSLPIDPGQPGSRALATWCAGFLEGAHPGHRALRLAEEPGRKILLLWEPEGVSSRMEHDFTLPLHGPLSPFQIAQLADLWVDAVLFIDENRKIRAWNRGACLMFGYTAQEALGSPWDLLVPRDLKKRTELDWIERETEKKKTLRNYITRRRCKDGRERIVSLSRTIVRNRRGERVGYGVILRDITDTEKLKGELQASRRLAEVGELASQVAHEVRNPLAGIHGAMQILRRKLHPGPQEQKVFEDVASEIARLDRLVSDLLRFGRPPAPRLSRVEISLFLKEWSERMEREAAARHAHVHWNLSTQAAARIDSILLEQVLRNLFENALEAAPGSCHIEVELARANGQVQITFRDDGPGVPPEIRNRVIEPFFTTKPRGSGLGLAICRRHLHSMGGSLTLLSSEKGAVFRLSLPLVSKEEKS